MDQLKGQNIMRNDSARADQTTLAQADSANNRCVCSDRDAFFNPGVDRNPVGGAATWRQVVCEHCVWSKENVIGHVNVFPETDAIFDRHIVANRDAGFDEGMIADVAVAADNHVLLDVSESPDACAIADVGCFDERLLVDEWCLF